MVLKTTTLNTRLISRQKMTQMPRPREHPTLRLEFNPGNNDGREGASVSKYTRMSKEGSAFLRLPLAMARCSHQDLTSAKDAHSEGLRSTRLTQLFIIPQMRMEKRQVKSRCLAVSSSRRQRGQSRPLGHPLRSRRSAVQTRF